MRSAASLLIGQHDFSAFRNSGCQAPTSVRTLYNLSVSKREAQKTVLGSETGNMCSFSDLGENDLEVTVSMTADAFLYRMVRNVVSILVLIGRYKLCQKQLSEIFLLGNEGKSRRTWQLAPASGLYLVDVKHCPEIMRKSIIL
jgi:tRNA pseudouridine38-40 synthase